MLKIKCPHCGETFEGNWSKSIPINFKKLREIRLSRGLLQRELGEKVDYTESSIGHWELGNYSPTLKTVKAMAKALNVDYEELLAEEK